MDKDSNSVNGVNENSELTINEDCFTSLYSHFERDLKGAANIWYAKLKSCGFYGDWVAVKSEIDEVFLSCIRSWRDNKKNHCKFRSYLITQLNRRLLNKLRYTHVQKRFNKNVEMLPFTSLAVAVFANTVPFDYDLDDDPKADYLNFIKGKDMTPDKVFAIKYCIDCLKTKSFKYGRIIEIIDNLVNNEHEHPEYLPGGLYQELQNRLNISKSHLGNLLNKMRKEIVKILGD